MKKTLSAAVMAIALAGPVLAQECDINIANAVEAQRQEYINGMTGLATNNYSGRPGTYSSMACLDKFMQGDMDIFFRPPALDDLLQQALSFACEQIADAITGSEAGGGGQEQVLALLQSMSGGLSVPNQGGGTSQINVLDFVQTQAPDPTKMVSGFGDIFGAR
mgnify:CR=1 FL=1|jgi:hypothetical protein